jgi:hypothetical protein
VARGSDPLCCGCGRATTPRIGHFLGKRRLFSLLGLRVRAAPTLAKSPTYARRFIVNHGDRGADFARVSTLVGG